MSSSEPPPVAKYKYTLVITGNSHAEILGELLTQTRGGYLLDSDYERRDSFTVYGGRKVSSLEHKNPAMTAERYEAELAAWFDAPRPVETADLLAGLDADQQEHAPQRAFLDAEAGR